jgi:hypothetical protein
MPALKKHRVPAHLEKEKQKGVRIQKRSSS